MLILDPVFLETYTHIQTLFAHRHTQRYAQGNKIVWPGRRGHIFYWSRSNIRKQPSSVPHDGSCPVKENQHLKTQMATTTTTTTTGQCIIVVTFFTFIHSKSKKTETKQMQQKVIQIQYN